MENGFDELNAYLEEVASGNSEEVLPLDDPKPVHGNTGLQDSTGGIRGITGVGGYSPPPLVIANTRASTLFSGLYGGGSKPFKLPDYRGSKPFKLGAYRGKYLLDDPSTTPHSIS